MTRCSLRIGALRCTADAARTDGVGGVSFFRPVLVEEQATTPRSRPHLDGSQVLRVCRDRASGAGAAIQLWTGLHGFVSLHAVVPELGAGRKWPTDADFLCGLYADHLGAQS